MDSGQWLHLPPDSVKLRSWRGTMTSVWMALGNFSKWRPFKGLWRPIPCTLKVFTLSESSHWKVLTADEKVRGPHLSLPELPQKHGMLTQDVLRTKLSRSDCYGTWSQSRQCYQGPQAKRQLKGWTSVQFCLAAADGRSPLNKATTSGGSCWMVLCL